MNEYMFSFPGTHEYHNISQCVAITSSNPLMVAYKDKFVKIYNDNTIETIFYQIRDEIKKMHNMFFDDGTAIPCVPNDPFYNFRKIIGIHIRKRIQSPLNKASYGFMSQELFNRIENVYINTNVTFKVILTIHKAIHQTR